MSTSISKWQKLDNSAKIYPMMAGKNNENIFRLTFVMHQNVQPNILQKALDMTMVRFPSFKVMLKKGLFWYYFDKNDMPIKVFELEAMPTRKILTNSKNNGYCFKISYYNNLITGDFFHALCDGAGASEFMKSLIYTYLNLLGNNIHSDKKILTLNTPINPKELEDSFLTNSHKVKLKDLKINALKGSKQPAYLIDGLTFEDGGLGIVHLYCPIKDLLAICKQKECTATEFLASIFFLSIYDAKIKDKREDAHNIQIFCPINLRKMFGSISLRNFSLFSRISANPYEDMDLDKLISIVHQSLQKDMDKDFLKEKISTTVMGEKFFPMRIMPLVLKQLIFKISNLFFGNKKKTATFSNVGIMQLPDDMKDFVKSTSFSISVNQNTPLSLTAVTTFDTLCLTFTRCITDTDIELAFAKHLMEYGLDVSVNSNMWEVEHAL